MQQSSWRRSGRISRRRFVGVGGAGLAAAWLAACGGGRDEPGGSAQGAAVTGPAGNQAQQERQAKAGGTLTVGLPNEPEYQSLDLNRTIGTWTHLIGMTLFDTLVVEDADKNLKPALAQSWEESPDGLSIVFKLRPNAVFHDGTPVNAEAVRYMFNRVADEGNNRALAFSYLGNSYESTEVIDQTTARVRLKSPNATLTRRLTRAYFGVPSPTAAEKAGFDAFARQPVGSGPFIFKEWVAKERVIVVKNPRYEWTAPIFRHTGPPYLDQITFRVIPDQATRTAALESGDVQVIDEVPPVDVERFSKEKNYNSIVGAPQGTSYLLRMNTRQAPTSDLNVRRALNHAIDKNALIRTVYFGVHVPAYSPLTASSFGYNPNLKDMYPFDRARARALLDQAGWTAGQDGVRRKDGQELVLTYHSSFRSTSELLQAQLRELGVRVNIQITAPGTPTNQADLEAKNNLADQGSQQAGFLNEDPDILRSTSHPRYDGSQSWATFIGFKDQAFADLLDRQQQLPRGPEREKLLQEAQRIMMENALVVPLFDGRKALITAKNVQGIVIMPVNFYAWFYDANLA